MRHPLILDHRQSALVVIDVQEKFRPIIDHFDEMVDNVKRLIAVAQQLGVPVLVTEHYPKGLGKTVLEVAGVLASSVPVIEKITFSCCQNELFMSQITALGRKQILICGLETHVCVCQTALDLLQSGLQVQVALDACSSSTVEKKILGKEKMNSSKIIITSAETALFDWLVRADTQEFKAALPHLKPKKQFFY